MLRAVFFLLEDQKKKYIFSSVALILILFYDLVPAFVVGRIVDFFTVYKPGNSLTPLYFYAIFLASTLALVSQMRLSLKKGLTNIQSETAYTTRVKGFERLLDFSLKWHDAENTGNKVQKIQQGTESMRFLQRLLSNEIFPQFTAIIGVLVAFSFLNYLFFAFGLVYLALFIAVQIIFYKQLLKVNYDYNTALEKASGTYYEGLSNVLTIKTLGVKDDFKKNISGQEERSRDFALKRTAINNKKWKTFQIINALAMGSILILAGQGFVNGIISIGSLFVIYTYFQKLSGAMGDSTEVIDNLISCKVSIAMMMPIFEDELSFKQGIAHFPKDWRELSIYKGFFSYIKNEKMQSSDSGLNDLNIQVAKHEKVGVVGKSGSGKSTFAKILLGLYGLENGEYKIGNIDFYSVKHSQITDNIALVLQDSEMFNLSLKDNITLMRKFDSKLFEQAIEISSLLELIEKLPDGIDTLIGEKGYRLSGGERQRIGIARAIYKDPQILILDEATSSLDSKTETSILRSFEQKLQKKTIISIAHRISTLKNVDRIVVFDRGTIVEEGTFSGLSKDSNSKFHEIYQSQQMNDKVSK